MGVATLGIAKFFNTKILKHGNKEPISSTIFCPSNLLTWISFHTSHKFSLSFEFEKIISTYAKEFCNKIKAIHQISNEKNKISISLQKVPIGLPNYKRIFKKKLSYLIHSHIWLNLLLDARKFCLTTQLENENLDAPSSIDLRPLQEDWRLELFQQEMHNRLRCKREKFPRKRTYHSHHEHLRKGSLSSNSRETNFMEQKLPKEKTL